MPISTRKPSSRSANQYRDEFIKLANLTYADQAKWFLNGFWKEGLEAEAENVWNYAAKFVTLDKKKGKEGCDLDEFGAHQFLESFEETLTVVEMRQRLKDIDLDFNGKVALIEFLIFKYNKSLEATVDAPQGSPENEEELKAAEAKLRSVQTALAEVEAQLQEQSRLLEELRAAVEDLKKQESEHNNAINALERITNDESVSTVKRSKAANELAQLRSTDPLPLRRAKITQEAAVRKVEQIKKVVEAAVAEAVERVNEAEEYLDRVRRKGGVAHGSVWWMSRELHEARKYLPLSKGGIARK